MKKNKGLWILLAVLVLLLGGIASIFMGGDTPVQGPPSTDTKGRLVEFSGADLKESKDGKDIWRVTAQKILYNTETKEVELTNMEVFFVQEGNTLRVQAEKGHMAGDRSSITMDGTVTAQSTDGASFTGKNLYFDNGKKQLTAREGFTFKRDDLTLTGDVLEADMVMNLVKAKGHVRLTKGE